MYRVGFGDCFLLSLPDEDGTPAYVLVDCGVHSQGDIGTMDRIVDDLSKECGGHLTLIIATHAHQDHISGFARRADVFKRIKVDEVWLPWTENPKDPGARAVKQKQLALAEALRMHFQAAGIRSDALFAVLNAAGNQAALDLLKAGVNGGTVQYLEAGKTLIQAAGIKELTVQVLGPPRDEKFLARMDPPTGDRFLKLGLNGKAVPSNVIEPFVGKWTAKEGSTSGLPTLRQDEKKALKALLDSASRLAFSLDQAINNTSLVTLFSFRQKHLLFPGDAQYGNWQYWINTPEGESILEHIDFLKVAHHGSLNATPKSALAKMPNKGFAAMLSTQNHPWPSIPFGKMLAVLNQKATGVVRSDSIPITDAKEAPTGPKMTPMPGFTPGPFWCDYTLSV